MVANLKVDPTVSIFREGIKLEILNPSITLQTWPFWAPQKKICSSNVLEDIKSVVSFGFFTVDWDFGLHLKLFRITLKELSYPLLN